MTAALDQIERNEGGFTGPLPGPPPGDGMIRVVDPANGPEAVAGGGGRVTGAVVPRPALLGRVGGPARVTIVSAPAGSGKTVLLRSWLGQAGLDGRAAWVPTGRGERDPQRFWVSVIGALGQTSAGAGLVRAVSAAPDLDGWGLVERLLADLARLEDRLWLVIDDVHELGPEALRQLELLVMRAPPQLRFVLAARHDVRLGLHRLRLEGELTEIRAADLKFTLAEAAQLLAAAGVEQPDLVLAALHERTEGWAAGLRLAALALTGHPDPVRFAAEFSGTERTVAEYLLAEVLDRQPGQVRRLLLRTSVLEQVNGELAHLLTGDDGAERVLQDLEQAGSFVVSLDMARTWFRYHQMFGDLLQLELRRAEPGEVTGLHGAAAGWLAAHGFGVEAIRHAQAARDWVLATRLLVDQWTGLYLDGQATTIHELLAGFPAGLAAADAGLAVVTAADELTRGSLEAAARYLDLAERQSENVPEARRGRTRLLLGVVRLLLARQRGDLSDMAEDAGRLPDLADAAGADAQTDLHEELRALALINVGSTLYWTARREEAGEYLERGVALARRIERPYLEFIGLAYRAAAVLFHSYVRAAAHGRRAIELARRHGWTGDPAFGVACGALGTSLAGQGRPDEAEPWIQEAERTLTAEAQPAQFLAIRYDRGVLEQARGRDAAALAAFEAVEPLARRLASPHLIIPRARAQLVHSLVRLDQTERAAQILAGLSGQDREHGEIRIAAATLWLAQRNPQAALTELAPILDSPARVSLGFWLVMAYVLEAAARDALGDQAAADSALEHALDLAEPDGALTPFLLSSSPGLLDRHARHHTAHASLLAAIRAMLDGAQPGPPSPEPQPLPEPLSGSEIRVLRYLPTHLNAPEIARELYISPNTVKTHVRNLYAKLGTHSRAEAVERARALGLLAPSGTGHASRRDRTAANLT
jgi:LuxR family transcriptional regulator, maltose regulon positive regulatory protein